MFIAGDDLRRRLNARDIVIDPLYDEPPGMGPSSIDLRLGTQVLVRSGPEQIMSHRELAIGDDLRLGQGETATVSTLEYVGLPGDVVAIGSLRSSFSRVAGITLPEPVWIEPGFEGRLTLTLRNGDPTPVVLVAGQRLLSLRFALLSSSVTGRHVVLYDTPTAPELRRLREDFAATRAVPAESAHDLRRLLADALDESTDDVSAHKGRRLEDLVVALIERELGLSVVKARARLAAEELDVIVENRLSHGFWRFAGSPLVIECRNWSKKVGAAAVSGLSERLRSMGPDAKTGVLVCKYGITGDERRDAILKVREKRQVGQYIVVLDREDLNRCVQGESFASAVERRYTDLLLY